MHSHFSFQRISSSQSTVYTLSIHFIVGECSELSISTLKNECFHDSRRRIRFSTTILYFRLWAINILLQLIQIVHHQQSNTNIFISLICLFIVFMYFIFTEFCFDVFFSVIVFRWLRSAQEMKYQNQNITNHFFMYLENWYYLRVHFHIDEYFLVL